MDTFTCTLYNKAAEKPQKRGKQPSTVGILIAAVKFMEANWP